MSYGKRLSKTKIEERTEMFVAGLIAMNFNASQAAIAVGVPPAGAGVWASHELRKPNVQAVIAKRIAGVIEKHDVTIDALVMRLKDMAYGSIGNFIRIEDGKPVVDMSNVTERQLSTLSAVKVKERVLKQTSDEGMTTTLLERTTEFRMHDARSATTDLLKFVSGGAKGLQDNPGGTNIFNFMQNNVTVTVEQKADAYRGLLDVGEDAQEGG